MEADNREFVDQSNIQFKYIVSKDFTLPSTDNVRCLTHNSITSITQYSPVGIQVMFPCNAIMFDTELEAVNSLNSNPLYKELGMDIYKISSDMWHVYFANHNETIERTEGLALPEKFIVKGISQFGSFLDLPIMQLEVEAVSEVTEYMSLKQAIEINKAILDSQAVQSILICSEKIFEYNVDVIPSVIYFYLSSHALPLLRGIGDCTEKFRSKYNVNLYKYLVISPVLFEKVGA